MQKTEEVKIKRLIDELQIAGDLAEQNGLLIASQFLRDESNTWKEPGFELVGYKILNIYDSGVTKRFDNYVRSKCDHVWRERVNCKSGWKAVCKLCGCYSYLQAMQRNS